MTTVFVYEFTTSGGLLDGGEPIDSALAREGRAMLAALVEDFSRIEGVEVFTLLDHRLSEHEVRGAAATVVSTADEHRVAFRQHAADADATVVIAPEFDDHLLRCAERVIAAGGCLLGPAPEVIALTSDKHATAEYLRAHGVAAPQGCKWRPGQPWPSDLAFPLVIKPLDGAGSIGVQRIDEVPNIEQLTEPLRIETYQPGLAASVAVLAGPTGRVTLPACRQRLSDDGGFHYRGGSCPLPPPLAARAARLADEAIGSLGEAARGYLGVDLVLGPRADGSDDVVIEINPRLTTSYVGLRALALDNLADAMLRTTRGERPIPRFRDAVVEFDTEGTVRIVADRPTVGAVS